MNNIFSKIFNRKITNLDQEELIEQEVINYNSNIIDNSYGIVIKYDIIQDNDIPVIIKICDFHFDNLPAINSIIWAPNKNKTKLEPYKVIRFDFIEDDDNKGNIYIVVVDANIQDIITYNVYD